MNLTLFFTGLAIISVTAVLILFMTRVSSSNPSDYDAQHIVTLKKQLLSKWPSSLDINTLIDIPVAYINLDQSTTRRNRLEHIFDTYIIHPRPVRIRAVLGTEYLKNPNTELWISPELHPLLRWLVDSGRASPGELGCLLSHMKTILYGYQSNLSSLLVLEDDVDFSCVGLWNHSLSTLIGRLPSSDWNFVQLYYDCFGLVPEPELAALDDGILCSGTVAYIISARCMAALYNIMFDNFVLTTRMYSLVQKKGLSFSADSVIYNILNPRNVYIEKLQRFVMDNFEASFDSTIHIDHTQSHRALTQLVWNRYIDSRPKYNVESGTSTQGSITDM